MNLGDRLVLTRELSFTILRIHLNMNDLREPLEKIRSFYRFHKRMPSFSEVARLFNYASKNAAYRLIEKLISKGLISKDSKGKLLPSSKMSLPILGYVQAGFPLPAEEELIDTLNLDEYLISKPEISFMLKVSGDSMVDAGIQPNDIVIVEKKAQPKNGDIVLAQVDQEWTLKYFYKEKNKISLVAANAKYPPIFPKEELSISGVIKGVIRKY